MKSVNEFNKKMKKISYELWTDKKLYIAHMKIWECECWIHVSLKQDTNKLNPWAIEDVFIDYTEDPSQYLIWVPERKKVIKTTNPTFIEDQQGMSEPEISKPAELERAQQEGAQQVEILPLDSNYASEKDDENTTENSSNENEFLKPIDNEKDEFGPQLDATTRSGQTVRLIKKMQQSKI